MGRNLGLAAVLVLCVCGISKAQEHLVVNHKPSYIALDSTVSDIILSEVQHALLSIFGFTDHKDLKFTGLYASTPFQVPTASVVLALYGGNELVQGIDEPKLNLKVDDIYVPSHSLRHKLQHFYSKKNNIIEVSHETKPGDLDGILEGLSDDKHLAQVLITDLLPTSRLTNSTNDEVVHMLKQVSLILQALTRVSRHDDNKWTIPGVADFYSFELHVPTSDSDVLNEEINALMSALIEKVNEVMTQMYGDNYVSLVLSLPESNVVQSRKVRSLLATDEPVDAEAEAKAAGLSVAWSSDYPVIFHIILWLVVFMAILTIFVTHGMMTMDPGNDSIIYRMTTTRLKKE